MQIGGFTIGAGRCFVVAELSGNMTGSLETAKRMVVAAKECGADAVKVQTLDPFDMPDKDEIVKGGVPEKWVGRRWFDVYKATFLPWQEQLTLKAFAEDVGVIFFASVYSAGAVDFWERNGNLPAYKIAGWQSGDNQFIRHVAQTYTPVIVTMEQWHWGGGVWHGLWPEPEERRLAFLVKENPQYVSENIQAFGNWPVKPPIGYSNHGDPMNCVEAVRRGAVIVEQHFRIDEGLDTFAAPPEQFRAMVGAIRKEER